MRIIIINLINVMILLNVVLNILVLLLPIIKKNHRTPNSCLSKTLFLLKYHIFSNDVTV